eukprot:m.477468 g.477468  ORF g.477468 m.477468 type:complete len:327 (+) comp20852_c0_seq1:89-1069(+)
MFRAVCARLPVVAAASVSARRAASTHASAGPSRRPAVLVAVAAGAGAAGLALTNPAQCFFWPSKPAAPQLSPEFKAIRAEISDLVSDGHGPLLVRLAWHASGTYDKASGTGGSNGATMRFAPESTDGANAGLQLAQNLLEPIKAKNPSVSYSDLWTFAGAVAIEEMGGPAIPWTPGRTDKDDGTSCPANGLLPDATQGPGHVRDVFYRMGFNDREIVALIGAHTLGECHADRSGFVGPWTRDPNGFDNSFFTLLLEEKWQLEVAPNRPAQFWDASHEIMMLPADIALVTDPQFRVHVEEFAAKPEVFDAEFAAAFGKLLDLGVTRS